MKDKEEERIIIYLKEKNNTSFSKCKKVFPSMDLNEFRKKENLSNDWIFIKDDSIIEIKDEKDFKIFDVLSENNIYIYKNQNIKSFSIYVEDNKICDENISEEKKISELRELLKNKIEKINDYYFINENNNSLDKNDENEFLIKEFFLKNKIILKSLKPKIKKNKYLEQQNNTNNEISVNIVKNNIPYESKNFSLDILLIEIRNKMDIKNFIFLNKNNSKIDIEDENKIKLSEIITNDNNLISKMMKIVFQAIQIKMIEKKQLQMKNQIKMIIKIIKSNQKIQKIYLMKIMIVM